MSPWLRILLYLVGAPVLGCLLAGLDRKLSARLQSRLGPPLLQPLYDAIKLLRKENIVVRRSQNFFIIFFLLLVIFTGALFFAGADLLLVIFALTLGAIFFVLGAYKASSPYSFIGAERELIQMMAYEPMVLLTGVGMYMVTRSFYVDEIARHPSLLILSLPGVFLGFLYTLEIKFRKSPFDLSCSHHAHQELVRGITTEFSGRAMAMIEIAHWYENVFLLGWIYLFFASMPAVGVAASLLVFLFVILVDNVFARLKWQAALRSAWAVAIVLGFGNIVVLSLIGTGSAGIPAGNKTAPAVASQFGPTIIPHLREAPETADASGIPPGCKASLPTYRGSRRASTPGYHLSSLRDDETKDKVPPSLSYGAAREDKVKDKVPQQGI